MIIFRAVAYYIMTVSHLGTGLLNHRVKKWNMTVVMTDLDRTYSPQQQALMLLSVSISNITSFNIAVCVMINDYHHLKGGGSGAFIKVLHDSHVGHACNDCNGSTICIYSWTENFSLTVMLRGLMFMKMKPHLHNGTVMVDMDKNRLIEIPPNGGEPPDIGLTRTW